MLTSKPELINYNFNLPCHDNELLRAEKVINELKFRVNIIIKNTELISDDKYLTIFEEIINILDYVGRLSMPAFNIESEIEEMYIKKFHHAPELSKRLWLDHYGNIHKQYNTLKNRCFKLINDIDKHYTNVHGKKSPN